jgi:hypothetical protein
MNRRDKNRFCKIKKGPGVCLDLPVPLTSSYRGLCEPQSVDEQGVYIITDSLPPMHPFFWSDVSGMPEGPVPIQECSDTLLLRLAVYATSKNTRCTEMWVEWVQGEPDIVCREWLYCEDTGTWTGRNVLEQTMPLDLHGSRQSHSGSNVQLEDRNEQMQRVEATVAQELDSSDSDYVTEKLDVVGHGLMHEIIDKLSTSPANKSTPDGTRSRRAACIMLGHQMQQQHDSIVRILQGILHQSGQWDDDDDDLEKEAVEAVCSIYKILYAKLCHKDSVHVDIHCTSVAGHVQLNSADLTHWQKRTAGSMHDHESSPSTSPGAVERTSPSGSPRRVDLNSLCISPSSVSTKKGVPHVCAENGNKEAESVMTDSNVLYLNNGDKIRKIPERPLQRRNERFARVAFIVVLIGSAACDMIHKSCQAVECLPVLYVRMERIARKANEVLFGTS